MELAKRKPNRLKHYDYSQCGTYFITICVQNRRRILSDIAVGACIASPCEPELSKLGKIVDSTIKSIPSCYPDVKLDKYVIMPNHIHMLLSIVEPDGGRAMLSPTTVSRIVQHFKGAVTKQCGAAVWQKSFYDHIIRDEFDYESKWKYIDDNPLRWQDDEFYTEVENCT